MPRLQESRIAVIEDSEFMLMLMRVMLRGFGFRNIRGFATAEEFLKDAFSEKVHLILADQDMPGQTGLQLLEAIRAGTLAVRKEIPFILCTPVTDMGFVFDARDAGVDEICIKPIMPANLYQKIKLTLTQPRAFVVSEAYQGPDRRRQDDPGYQGPERRRDYHMSQERVDALFRPANRA